MKNSGLVSLFIILGLVLVVVGYVYASHTADTLPSYFPGHDATLHTVHVKHSIAAFVLAALSFILAWFQSGPKKAGSPEQ